MKRKTITSSARRRRKIVRNVCLTAVSVLIIIFIVFPILYMVLNSLMSESEIKRYYGEGASLHMIPDVVSLESYYRIMIQSPEYLRKFWISLAISGVIVLAQFVFSAMAAFAFAKYRFKGRKVLLFVFIMMMLLPVQTVIVPNYLLFDNMKLINTYWCLIVSGSFMPFGTVLLTQGFKAVPNELIEAARLDGAGTMRILWQIILPVAKGSVICLLILTFIDAWNMVEQPVAFLNETYQYPLSVFLAYFNKDNLAMSFSCGVLSMLPGLLLFLYYRDELAEGIEVTGL